MSAVDEGPRDRSAEGLLAAAALDLLGCRSGDEVQSVITGFLSRLVPNAVIIVNEVPRGEDILVTREIAGIDGSSIAKAAGLMGFEIRGRRWAVSPSLRRALLGGTLWKVPGGIAELASSELPTRLANSVAAAFGIRDVYTMGITDGVETLGNANILTRTPGVELPTGIIESFARHCYSAWAGLLDQKALAESAQTNRLLLGNMAEGLALHEIILGEDGKPYDYRYLDVNPAFEAVTGLKAEDVIGRTAREVIPGIESAWIELYGEVAMTGIPARFENDVAGLGRTLAVSAYSPRLGQFASVITDVTESRQNEMLLRSSESRRRSLFEQEPDGIVILDPETARPLEFNHTAHLQLGYTREEFATLTVSDIEVLETPEETEAHIGQVIREGRSDFETLHRTKSGEIMHVYVTAQAVNIAGQTVYQCIWRDVTKSRRIEEALRESGRWLNESQRVAHLGHYIFDIRADTWDGSDSLYDVLGVSAEYRRDFAGWLGIVHPADRERLSSYFTDDVVAKRTPFDIKYRIVRPGDGAERWVHGLGTVDYAEDGEPKTMFGVIQDVTESKLAEGAIRESEAKFRNFIDFTYDWEYWIEPGVRLIYTSPSCERITGYTAEELMADPTLVDSMVHEADRELVKCHVPPPGEDGGSALIEYRIVTKSGMVRWIEHSCRPVANSAGEQIGRRVTIRDITDRKEGQAALRDSQERLGVALKAISMGTWEWDPAHHVIRFDDAARKLFGGSRRMTEVTEARLASLIHDEDIGRLPAMAGAVLKTGIGLVAEFRVVPADGVIRWVAVRGERHVDGDAVSVLGVVWDATETVGARTLKVAKDAAEEANRAKSAFLASMSHEIRTPMNAILGFAELMSRDPSLSTQQRERLDIVNRSGEHLLAIIDDVLELSKIEAGRATPRISSFDVRELVGDLDRVFTMRAAEKRLAFRATVDDVVPQYLVSDPRKVRQVLINLLTNAVKFTTEGSVSLHVGVASGPTGTRLTAEVNDTGPGIPPHEMQKLFKYFEQTAAGRSVDEGTGLGLAISREFVRLLGGQIFVASELGVGSTFAFWVPAEEGGEVSGVSAVGSRRVVGIAPGFGPYRVLVADDASANRELLTQYLKPLGFELRTVNDGEQAVAEFAAWKPDLVLMDLRMPVMDGYEAIKQIRGQGGQARILAVTADAFADAQREALQLGVDDFLIKPLREKELLDKIAGILGLEYVFDETRAPDEVLAEPFSPDAFSDVPPFLVDELRHAAITADFDLVTRLADQVETFDAAAAAVMRHKASAFDGEGILSAIEVGSPD